MARELLIGTDVAGARARAEALRLGRDDLKNLIRALHAEASVRSQSNAVGLRQQPEYTAAAGEPFTGIKFRSPWERRLAAALDRVGVKWSYEPDWFTYPDGTGRWRRYTPDFRLDDLHNTYVEVKGPSGADAGDSWKMQRVIRNYPALTLLLWDAGTIEYIEDLADATQVLGLLTTTRLAA